MADKFRRVFPIEIKFVDGELPPAPKLNALGSQTRNGMALIEKAIGDIFNQSGDQNLAPPGDLFANALFINSLARALGGQHLISPRIPDVSDIATYRDVITHTGADAGGSQEGFLRYKPVRTAGDETDFTIIDSGGGAIVGAQYKLMDGTAGEQLDTAGDWHVTENGRLLTFSNFTSVTLEYDPIVQPDVDSDATFNVIPDPNTAGAPSTQFFGIKIAYANDTDNSLGYWLYLPPRRPLSRELAKSPDETENERTGTYFFQDPTDTAQNTTHHRYKFSSLVTGIISDAVGAGFSKPIPDNYLYLYDHSTGTIIDGLTWDADSSVGAGNTWIVRVSGAKLDQLVTDGTITIATKADESDSAYSNNALYLVQPGTTMAQIVSALLQQFKDHTHTNADGTLPVSHNDLKNLFDNNSPEWGPSNLAADDHPQYLHRDGFDGTATLGLRDAYRGGMRGSLLLLSTSSATNYFNVSADSRRLHFGNDTNSLWFEYNAGDPQLSLLGIPRLTLKDVDAALKLNDIEMRRSSAGELEFYGGSDTISSSDVVMGRLYLADQTSVGTERTGSEPTLRIDAGITRSNEASIRPINIDTLRLGEGAGAGVVIDSSGSIRGSRNFYFPPSTTHFTGPYLNNSRVDKLAQLDSVWPDTKIAAATSTSGGSILTTYTQIGATLGITLDTSTKWDIHYSATWTFDVADTTQGVSFYLDATDGNSYVLTYSEHDHSGATGVADHAKTHQVVNGNVNGGSKTCRLFGRMHATAATWYKCVITIIAIPRTT